MKVTQTGGKGLEVHRQPDTVGTKFITPHRSIVDYSGREAMVAAFGEQLVGFKEAEILNLFTYFVNPEHVDTSLSTGSWSATVDDSRLKVTAGAGSAAGDAIVQSKRVIGYRPGFDSYTYCTIAFDSYLPGTTMDFGPHDDIDGYSISLNANNELVVNHFAGGVLVESKSQSEFILDRLDGSGPSGFIVNPQAMNTYRISYGYLGELPPSFEIYGGMELGWIPFHYIDPTGTSNLLIIKNPFLPLRMRVTSDGTNEVSMYSGSWQGGVIGTNRPRYLNDQFTVDVERLTLATGGVNTPILSIRNDTTFKTKNNKMNVDIDTITCAVEGNKNHRLRLIKNANLTGAAFTPVDTDSTVSYDLTATAMSGGQLKRSWPLGKIDSLGVGAVFETGELRMVPGDVYTLALISTSVASDVDAGIHWDELK